MKVAVITGGASGIGLAAARLFRQKGYEVAVCGKGKENVARAAKEGFFAKVCDVGDFPAVERFVDEVERKIGPVYAWVNNAAVLYYGPFERIPRLAEEEMIETNILGVINGCRAVLPRMRKRNHGHIVNISSLASVEVGPNSAVYSGSKAFVNRFTTSLREELRGSGVRVHLVVPTFTKTDLHRKEHQILPHPSTLTAAHLPEKPAAAILEAIEKNRNEVVVGIPARFVYRMNHVLPGFVDNVKRILKRDR